jgi:hypothetical protein
VNRGDEPPVQRWVNDAPVGDDEPVTHLLNVLSGGVLIYAAVTRGGLAVSKALAKLSR